MDATKTLPESSTKKVCCYCINPCSGAHQCWKCKKPCHAITPCSFAHDGEEGFGSKVTCCHCWLNDDVDESASAVVSTEPISNQNDEALSQFITEQIVTDDNNNINDAAEWASQTKRKHRAYSIQEKVEILDFAKKSSIHAASRHFGIDRKMVREWKKQEANLRKEAESSKRKRLEGGGRKVPNGNFEEVVFHYTHVYAADETAVWLDPGGGTCVAEKGSNTVTVLNTGHEKARVTVLLTARSDGTKMRPFVLLPRKRPVPNIIDRFRKTLVLS
ncbi:hypothetical protein niasHS_009087 [Heterodera schachtii]|uniref:SCAN domain-containing protein n=1 Tax=Heterodera schachtii TaxID=97005 RepID=A0ABD2J9H4_HETSC